MLSIKIKKLVIIFSFIFISFLVISKTNVYSKSLENSPISNENIKITLYYSDKDSFYLIGEERNIETKGQFPEYLVFEELQKGPQRDDLHLTVSQDIKLISAITIDGICHLNLSKNFPSTLQGTTGESLAINAIVNSLTELNEIDKVQFYLEGEKGFETGHNTYYEPLERNEDIINPNIHSKIAVEINSFLPKLGETLTFDGVADSGHSGILKKTYEEPFFASYSYYGNFTVSEEGQNNQFVVKYNIDYERGTVTEMAISNESTGKAEVYSKLHNVVLLKAPFNEGSTWNHTTTIDEKKYTLNSEIINTEGDKLTVRHIANGVEGYFNNKYIEERTYQKNKGLISFKRVIKMSSEDYNLLDIKDDNDYLEKAGFGYWLFEN